MRCSLDVLVLGSALALGSTVAIGQTPGTADPTWTVPSRPAVSGSRTWTDVATQPDGKVLVSGEVPLEGGTAGVVWRYDEHGELDLSFANAGMLQLPVGTAPPTLAVDGLGRIYLHAESQTEWRDANGRRIIERGLRIARLLPDGALDPAFNGGDYYRTTFSARYEDGSRAGETWIQRRFVIVPFPGLLRLQPDGKLLEIGAGTLQNGPNVIAVMRLTESGSLDLDFGTQGIATYTQDTPGGVKDLLAEVASDGSIVAAYMTGSYPQDRKAHVVRLTRDGAADTGFGNSGAISASGIEISSLAVQPDDRILVGGQIGGNAVIARLTANGARDTDFGNNGIAVLGAGTLDGIELEAGGGIIALAQLENASQDRPPSLLRLAANGTIDGHFARTDLAGDTTIHDMAVGQAAYVLSPTLHPDFTTTINLRKYVLEPWPRTGSLSTGQTPSVTGFRIDARNMSGLPVERASTADVVGLNGYIYTQSTDENFAADLFFVAASPQGWFMRNAAGAFVPWNRAISDLVPAYVDVPLTDTVHVPLYGGRLPYTGTYQLYLGYMRSDGGPLVYIDEPTILDIH